VADTLNRRAHKKHMQTINTYISDVKDTILEVSISNQHYLQIKETLQQGNLQQKHQYYEFQQDEILMYRGKVYVPNSRELKNIVLREMHNVPYVGHPGYHKSIAVVRRSQYFWLGMKKEVANYISRCPECQKVKT
jgi:hypothetical protein